MNPQFPLYIPSKSRADIAHTPRRLMEMGVPFRMIVEEHQYDDYAAHFPEDHLLVLDKTYQDEYDTFDELGNTKSKGPGPARNMAWQHSIDAGHTWHWVMDDNITRFFHNSGNKQNPYRDGTGFRVMEDFVLRYTNIGMAGPQYAMFAPARLKLPPFITGTRIYSCNLIRNDLPFRWRGRYNEDTDLSLRMLKAGWATVQFNAVLQNKLPTQTVPGGNQEAFYQQEGTIAKSEMLYAMHPDVTTVKWKFSRVHHYVDYSKWRGMKLLRDPNWVAPEVNPYAGLKVVEGTTYKQDRNKTAAKKR